MMDAEWLPVLMQGSFNEIYVIDAASLHFVYANHAACANLQFTPDEMLARTPGDIAPRLGPEEIERTIEVLRAHPATPITLQTVHVRRDGSCYPVEFRLLPCFSAARPVLIAIGNDTSARDATAEALQLSEHRFRAIATNTPGLVYQFLLSETGTSSFLYLSDRCHALLGIEADELRANAALFAELIVPEDRPSYFESMQTSARELTSWNWEGRLRIKGWNDIKWINLRSTPRVLPGQGILWDGIMANITQSRQGEAEIKRSRAQLAELSAHVQTVKEQERAHIAREIHDDLGGNLTAIKMALALLARRLPASDPGLADKATYVDSLVDRTIESVHRIADDLRPSLLDFGLVAAIQWHVKEFEKQSGIPCDFASTRTEVDLDPDQATALFRIFQEALTNVAKHAQATRVSVKMTLDAHNLVLDIADNGRGIAASDRLKPKSFGIRGMMERAMAWGGELSVRSSSDGGSIVTATIPFPATGIDE